MFVGRGGVYIAARGTNSQHGEPQLLLPALPADGDAVGVCSSGHLPPRAESNGGSGGRL